jgi:hypothetical protein
MKNDRQVYYGSGFKYVNHLPRAKQIAERRPVAVYVLVGVCLGFVLVGCLI